MENSKILALAVFRTLIGHKHDRKLVLCENPTELEKQYKKICTDSGIKTSEIYFLQKEGNCEKLCGYRGNVILVEGSKNETSAKTKEIILPLISSRLYSEEAHLVKSRLGHFSHSWSRIPEVIFSED